MLTLQKLFGEEANQSSSSLIIKKSSIGIVGNPSAQSILVAILECARRNFHGYITTEITELISVGLDDFIEYDNSRLEIISLFYVRNELANGNLKAIFRLNIYLQTEVFDLDDL
jgi:predicted nucleotide-binding protein (sugar kinase/HSP70/actin superfamily)